MVAPFSSIIIGEGPLVVECATALLDAGHALRGIVSDVPGVARWGAERGVPVLAPNGDVAGAMRLAAAGDSVDWIFSVQNPHILRGGALDVARRGAINYHDAPLPRYAGTHATSWALLAGETRHAITWHLIADRVDAGDILRQTDVEIAPADSALDLNRKCYVAGIEAFRELIAELAGGEPTRRAQDATGRSFFGRLRRPAAAAVLRWDRTSAELTNLVRALELGPAIANPLGRARLLVGDSAYLATRVSAVGEAQRSAPGTVLPSDDETLVVATADGAVAIREVRSLAGATIDMAGLRTRHELHAGARLPLVDDATVAALEARDAASRRGEDAWVSRLARLAPIALPYARAGAVASGAHATIGRPVPSDLRDALASIAGAGSRGEALLGAFAAYVRRIADRETSDIGVAIDAAATSAERALFVHVAPVSVDVADGATLGDAAAAFATRLHESATRGPILRDVVARYPALRPIAGRADGLRLPIVVALVDVPGAIAHVPDADVVLAVDRDATTWAWHYDAARLDRADVERMAAHVTTLVANAALEPARAASALPIVDAEERASLVAAGCAAPTPIPAGTVASHVLARHAERGDAVAVVDDHGATLTYDALVARSAAVARRLRAAGVRHGSRVGVCVERTVDLPVALLAVHRAGAAYVPVDPAYPADRIAYVLEDAGVDAILTDAAAEHALPASSVPTLRVDDVSDAPAQAIDEPVAQSDAAYVLYTSGSTGRPKGVVVPHGALVNFLTSMRERLGFAVDDAIVAVTTIAFDIAGLELWMPLVTGARIVLASRATATDGEALARVLATTAAERRPLLQATPATWRLLLDARWTGTPSLVALCGGEAWPPNLAGALVERASAVWNVYGPTETTIWSTMGRVRSAGAVTLGEPLANTTLYVLDASGELAPRGVAGELLIGGAGLAIGYHGRADLTAERFVEHPAFGRLYRTGDLVRWRADGALEYQGRLDDQVKVRGFRIELGEVEAALASAPNVKQGVVAARLGASGEQRLVGYVIANDGASDVDAIRAHLHATLPDYMVPSAFVVLDAFPLTGNGKVDRRALPTPDFANLARARGYVAPRTSEETTLAAIWADVLRIERVGADDDFFAIGGDSILLMRVVSRARAAGLEVAPADFFAHPTLAALASAARPIGATRADVIAMAATAVPGEALAHAGIDAASVVDAYPLTPMQQGLLFHELQEPESGAYHLQICVPLEGALDVAALRASFAAVVARHAVLRSAFVWRDVAGPVQVVLANAELPWRELDWRGESLDAQRANRASLLDDDRREGFVLTRAPLTRITLVRTGDARHEIVWSIHHIVIDGWSAHAILREVRAEYAARVAGGVPNAHAPLPFRAFVAELKRPDAAAESFWRARLAGFETPTPLVVDPPTGARVRNGRETLALDGARLSALQAFARAQGVTLNTLVQGAWALVLARYAGSDDILFGATVTTRPATLAGVDDMVGLFLNTLPVRARVDATASVGEWLRRLQREQGELRAHEHTPLAQIQRYSDVEPGTPLFDSLVVFENYPADASGSAASLTFGAIDIVEQPHYPLTLAIFPSDGLEVRAYYDGTRFSAPAIARTLAHLDTALGALVADATATVASLDVLPVDERRLVVETFNATARDYPREQTIGARFAETARATPDAIALIDGARTMTYRELDARSNQLAHRLRALGVGADTPVGLCTARSMDMVVGALGIVKAGGGYVTLDPEYPAERLGFMLADTAAPVVVTQDALRATIDEALGARSVAVISLDGEWASIAQEPSEPVDDLTTADGLAYVIFTSGSTGVPKGVMAKHRGVMRLVCNPDFARLNREETFLSFAPLNFDASTLEIWGALLNGARLVIFAQNTPSLDDLSATIATHGVTTLWLTAALFHQFVDAHLEGLRPLRQLLAGGDVLSVPHVRRVLDALPHLRLINGYGPTENTTFTCCYTIPRDDAIVGAVPIGRPIANTTCYIVDAAGRPVPLGVVGRLYTGGDGVARGYLNRAELTAERFIADPFTTASPRRKPGPMLESDEAPLSRSTMGPGFRRGDGDVPSPEPRGPGLYDTGDLARWRPDGNIDFLGRADQQLKIRGFRIEPGEIETRILRDARVRETVVVGREEAPGIKRLVAYVVPNEHGDSAALIDALRSALRDALPSYMVPSAFVVLDAMPLTPSGKVDRKRLPAPETDRDALSQAYVAPRTDAESALAEIWSKVLRVPQVGVEDNFFELGGDSILMIQVLDRARRAGLVLALRDLFKHPTIAELAKIAQPAAERVATPAASVGSETLGARALEQLGVAASDVEDVYPLASMQAGLLFHALAEPGGGEYHVQIRFAARGPLDVAAFKGAWSDVVRRHPILRTALAWEGVAAPRQVVLRDVPLDWREADWRGERDVASRMERLLDADRAEPFDLARAPLMRVWCVRTGDDAYEIVWSNHHILLDGWSSHALLREVRESYETRMRTRVVEQATVRPYRDYIAWLGQGDAGAESFWRAQLAGISSPTALGIDTRRAETDGDRYGHDALTLSSERTAALQAFARKHRVTLNTVFQGAWALVLATYAGDDDVLFGATVTTRPPEIDGVDRMMGLFLNTLPVRVRVDRDASLGAWLNALQDSQAEMRAHEATPLADIQRWSEIGSGTPLFDSIFVFENYPDAAAFDAPAAGVSFGEIEILERPHYPLTLLAIPGAEMALRVMFDATRFAPDAVARMLTHLDTALDGMLGGASVPVGAIDVLPAAERATLRSWEGERATYEGGDTLVALLAAQAARSPDAIAVADERRPLTYAELDSAATALARTLRASGGRAGQRVGVCAERSVELVIALVAAVKAGGAYVPFDPEYPRDRLAFMLEDADVAVLLATRAMADALPPHRATVVALDGVADARDTAAEPLPLPNADDPAYMIYTSGSTGKPKGALNAHRGIVNRLQWMQAEYGLTSADVVLQKTPFSFDVSVWEFFWPLMTGAKLVMARPGGHRDPGYLAEVMEREGVTVCHFVPSMLRAFVSNPERSEGSGRHWAERLRLRAVVASGEALPPDLVAQFYETLPNARLHNLYGPTECAVDVSYWACPPSTVAPAVVPIGRAVANTQLHVLDSRGREVPIGVPGELYLAGVQVGLGYHNRAELTNERFVPAPAWSLDSSRLPGDRHEVALMNQGPTSHHPRLYRTGDRARWRPDGTVEYLGRLDFQVKIRGFRIELGEIETTLLAHADVADTIVLARDERLVAYVVMRAGAAMDVAALRAHLGETLPDYMVPGVFVRLDAMPVTSNGKVDRRALPEPTHEGAGVRGEYVAPRTEAEAILAKVWGDVLRVERVGVHDDYYELGGDSILSIQIAARAREQGLKVGVTMLAKNPTVAQLAAVLGTHAAPVTADVGPITGSAPLTPIQRWFFELDPAERDHWNQTFLFRTDASLDVDALRGAIDALLVQHDVLRLRFTQIDGEWTQRFDGPGDASPLWAEDLTHVGDGDVAASLAPVTGRAARSLDIAHGPMLRAVWMPLGAGRGGRLLLAIHHLVVDGISWRILLEDLETAYAQLVAGQPVKLPARTTSYQQWAADLSAQATSDTLAAERPHWLSVSEGALATLPVDGSRAASNTVGESRTIAVSLDARETTELLQKVPPIYATQVNDVLLVALAEALGRWAGAGSMLVDLEGHGREDIVPDLDLTHTVGWFTSVFPVRLPLGTGPIAARIKAMKEMLRGVPRRGVGYGSLRYLTSDAELAARPTAEVVFNYLGQFDQLVADSKLFEFASESEGAWVSPAGRRRYLLDVNSLVINGRLEFRWTFGTNQHDEATIRRVAESMLGALRAILEHCRLPVAGGRTPSDYPLVSLTQAQVDTLAGDGRAIDDIVPLVPMQSLFLATTAGDGDVGFEQWRFEIGGALDVDAFRRAWQLMAARHEILRTAFHATGLTSPVQVIARTVDVPFASHDWRTLDESDREFALDDLLAEDRAAGFRTDVAPLVRLTLVRMRDDAWTFVWSNHHLLLDRWSWPIVLREVGIAYEALRAGRRVELPPATPWRRYVSWLAGRDASSSEAFWRESLRDLTHAPLPRLAGAGSESGERELVLTTDETERLRTFARERRVTLNALVSAAWSIWLARATGRSDVVFGLSIAGRPEEVHGIERLVGMCINNVPVRVHVDGEGTVASLVARVDDGQQMANVHGYAPLTDVQAWSGLPWHQRLFDSLLVFQHHGADDESANWLGDANPVLMVVDVLRTNYPLALVVGGKDALVLRLAFQGRHAGDEGADRVLAQLRDVLLALPNGADVRAALETVPVYAAVQDATPSRPIVAPRTDSEWVVARIWSELLGRDTVSVDDNFFDLGGQSLVATQIMSRMRDSFQLELPISLLFEHPTVEGFAGAVRRREPAPGRVERTAAIIRRVEEMTVQDLREAGIHE